MLKVPIVNLKKTTGKRRKEMVGNAGGSSRLSKNCYLAWISSKRANVFLHLLLLATRYGYFTTKKRVKFSQKLGVK